MKSWMPFEWIAALRFLQEGRMQSLLIIVGVGVGVAVIVFMSALLSGLQANLVRRTLSSQAHIVLLPAEEVARPQVAGEGALNRVQKQAQRLRSIDQWQQLRARLEGWPEIAAVSPVASGPAFAVRGDASKAVTLLGIEPAGYNRVVDLAGRLARAGADTRFVEYNGGHDYACWRGGVADGLIALLHPHDRGPVPPKGQP